MNSDPVTITCQTGARRHWHHELLNNFIELIKNLNLRDIPRSSIITPVSSMSILRYRFSPLRWSGLFFARDLGALRAHAGAKTRQDRALV
ncbi:MAG: hypothetical protein RL404_2810 [Pseudomonadota bacterium]